MAANRSLEEKKVNKIIALLDFDGTLTGASGQLTIRHALYGEFLSTGSPWKYYNDPHTRFIDEPLMIERIRGKLSLDTPDRRLALTESAKTALKTLLNQNAEIFIISKNRREWIEAMLKVHDFTAAEISKMTIYDVLVMGEFEKENERAGREPINPKSICVYKALSSKVALESTTILICDDDKNDFDAMTSAATGFNPSKIISINSPTGKFDFTTILREANIHDITLTVGASPAVAAPSVGASPPAAPTVSALSFWTRLFSFSHAEDHGGPRPPRGANKGK